MVMKSIAGKYNFYIDETIHALLAFFITGIFYFHGLDLYSSLFIFTVGAFLIDSDHLFNNYICKRILKIPNYTGTKAHGALGYSPHIFHGIDMAVLFGLMGAVWGNQVFGLALFFSLLLHILWDFLVYPNKASWLFLSTRLMKRCNVGRREYLVGKIFDYSSLRW